MRICCRNSTDATSIGAASVTRRSAPFGPPQTKPQTEDLLSIAADPADRSRPPSTDHPAPAAPSRAPPRPPQRPPPPFQLFYLLEGIPRWLEPPSRRCERAKSSAGAIGISTFTEPSTRTEPRYAYIERLGAAASATLAFSFTPGERWWMDSSSTRLGRALPTPPPRASAMALRYRAVVTPALARPLASTRAPSRYRDPGALTRARGDCIAPAASPPPHSCALHTSWAYF